MEKRKQYEPPIVEIQTFEVEDVLTTSGGGIELPDHEWQS